MSRAHAGFTRAALAVALGALAATIATAQQTIDGCQLFPTSNVWNTPVDGLPVDANSDTYIAALGGAVALHADFDVTGDALYGIPYNSVPNGQALVPIDYSALGFPAFSDPGPFPIPLAPSIEGGPDGTGDRHILVLRQGTCRLYELWYAYPNGVTAISQEDGLPHLCAAGTNGWCAGTGATWDLTSNALRPAGIPSADTSGLPVLPLLARVEEAQGGEIRHALRFTANPTRDTYVWPARFSNGTPNPNDPPMGIRVRLKASFDLAGYSGQSRRILKALKRYGMFLADTGPNWYVSGVSNAAWEDAVVTAIHDLVGTDFEVVDESSLMLDPNSGATRHIFSDGFENDVTDFANWSSHTP